MGSLPTAPNIGGPATGPQGTMYPSAPGTLPYSTTSSSLVQGIGEFLKNFHAARDADKDRNRQMFETGLQNLMAGVPVDQKKLAKYAKRAGLPLDFEDKAPDTHVLPSTGDQAAQAAMLAQGGMMPGVPPQAAAQAATPPPQQAPPPQVQPGLMDKLKSSLGMGGIGANSPVMQYLGQMGEMGKTNLATQGGEAKQKNNILNVMKAAMQGDPKAQEMATRIGLFHLLGPRDEMTLLMRKSGMSDDEVTKANMYMMMGGPQKEMELRKMAVEFAPRFGGDLQKSLEYVQGTFSTGKAPANLRPSLTFDEAHKQGTLMSSLQKDYPNAPPYLIHKLTETLTSPGESSQAVAKELFGQLQQYPSKAGQDFYQWSAEQAQKSKFHTDNMSVEWSRLAQTKAIHDQSLAMEQLNYLKSKAQDQFNNWWKIKEDKNADTTTKEAATTGLVDALKAQGVKGISQDKLDGFWGTVSGGLFGKTGKATVLKLDAPNFKSPDDAAKYWRKIIDYWTTSPTELSPEEEPAYKHHMLQAAPSWMKPTGGVSSAW